MVVLAAVRLAVAALRQGALDGGRIDRGLAVAVDDAFIFERGGDACVASSGVVRVGVISAAALAVVSSWAWFAPTVVPVAAM